MCFTTSISTHLPHLPLTCLKINYPHAASHPCPLSLAVALPVPLREQVWADADRNLQRINYWGKLNQAFLNASGPGCQVMPVSFDGVTSKDVAYQIPTWEVRGLEHLSLFWIRSFGLEKHKSPPAQALAQHFCFALLCILVTLPAVQPLVISLASSLLRRRTCFPTLRRQGTASRVAPSTVRPRGPLTSSPSAALSVR